VLAGDESVKQFLGETHDRAYLTRDKYSQIEDDDRKLASTHSSCSSESLVDFTPVDDVPPSSEIICAAILIA
jgi:hypothetical protein